MTSSRFPDGPANGLRNGPHYGLDIETDTTVDGLDPARSAVVAAAVATAAGDEVLLGAEAHILRRLDALLASLPPGVLVTWNGAGFDLPFLARRAEALRIPLALRLHVPSGRPAGGDDVRSDPGECQASWGAHGHLDGYRLYRADVGRTLGLSCGLKAMARPTGVAPVEVDRSRIHDLRDEELARYVASDARLARELVVRRLPAAQTFVDRCPPGPRSPVASPHAVTPA